MNGWLRAAGLGESNAVETTPLSQAGRQCGSILERETKERIVNESLRDRMKFRLCAQQAEGPAGQATWGRGIRGSNKASSMYLTRTQWGKREGEKQLLEEERETKKERGAVLTCSSMWGLYVGGGKEGRGRAEETRRRRKGKSKLGAISLFGVSRDKYWSESEWLSAVRCCRIFSPPLFFSLLLCYTTWAEGTCSTGGFFPGLPLSSWGWWGSWCWVQNSSITGMRRWCVPCLQCRTSALTSRASTASGAAWRGDTSTYWSSVITQASMRHVSNSWVSCWEWSGVEVDGSD